MAKIPKQQLVIKLMSDCKRNGNWDIFAYQTDQMEKTKIAVTEFRHKSEEFYPLIMFAALLLTLEVILKFTLLKLLP